MALDKNIVLVGMMGCGKSSVAKVLGDLLSEYEVVETDKEIELIENSSISEIFRKKGETYFRNCETAFLHQIKNKRKLIISCGGGMFIREENRKLLKTGSVSFYLSGSAKTLCNRLNGDSSRPLLNCENVEEKIKSFLKERTPYYELADLKIDTNLKSVEDVAKEVMEKFINYGK